MQSAKFNRNDSTNTIIATISCSEVVGFDAIARCGTGANVQVTLGHSNTTTFRQLGPVSSASCELQIADDDSDSPSTCEIFGFYAATLLHNAGLLDDNRLDELERRWNVNFRRNA